MRRRDGRESDLDGGKIACEALADGGRIRMQTASQHTFRDTPIYCDYLLSGTLERVCRKGGC